MNSFKENVRELIGDAEAAVVMAFCQHPWRAAGGFALAGFLVGVVL